MTVEPAPDGKRRETAKAQATRLALIELAAQLFAERGYVQTSIRDICRQGSVTSGAIYGHFRNKADLLAAAVSSLTSEEFGGAGSDRDDESADEPETGDLIGALSRLALEYPNRSQLRALLLQGAAAAQIDEDTRDSLREEQTDYLRRWSKRFEQRREAVDIDPSVDVGTAMFYMWAAELGLGILEAIGVDLPSPEQWSDIQDRLGRSLQAPKPSPRR
jgi:TetR/AcrR family acrAB operon transcriptional repressor